MPYWSTCAVGAVTATPSKPRVPGTVERNSRETTVPDSAEPTLITGAMPVLTTCSSIWTASGTIDRLARMVLSTRTVRSERSAGLKPSNEVASL